MIFDIRTREEGLRSVDLGMSLDPRIVEEPVDSGWIPPFR